MSIQQYEVTSSDGAIESVNPATGKAINSYPLMNDVEITNVLDKAQASYIHWSKTGLDVRQHLFSKLAELLERSKTKLADLMCEEMGKPIAQGIAEIEKCAWVCDYYVEHAETLLSPAQLDGPGKHNELAYRPLGVILAVMPWNFPFWQVFRFAIPNLLAGNVAVLKHASNVTGCSLAIERLFLEAGFPPDKFRSLLADSDSVSFAIAHSDVKGVAVTGSTAAGKSVAAEAGKHIKKCVLELGGSDPYLILEDADINAAANACAESRLLNAGQSCIAAKRLIVVDEIHDAFVEILVSEMLKRVVGDPKAAATDIGPMAREDLRNSLHEQVKDSVSKGARLEIGGKIPDIDGAFYYPTVLTNVTPGMPAYEEELFGPVAAIVKATDEAEAIAIANSSQFGLGAAVFTEDEERGHLIARDELEAGSCFVNDFVKSDPRLPFGGIKESGYGRELSMLGIREFLNAKSVVIA